MSLLLMIVYGLVVPGIAIVVAMWLWHQAKDRPTTIIAVVLIVPGFAWLAWTLYGGEKRLLDQQVRELCAKDGGIKVYETVKLPAERFNHSGQLNFTIPVTPYSTLSDTDEYFLEWEVTKVISGNPSLERSHFRLVRRSDMKRLGESVSYSRISGDLPGPWHESSVICPEITIDQSLESSVFVRGELKN
jgi:hypothetical protein